MAAAYLWGVVDALAQKANMYDVDTIAIHILLCGEFIASSPQEGAALAGAVQSPDLMPIIRRGGQAALDWMSNKDTNAPLVLSEILMGD
ncbi:hypothetical protein PHYC_00136 [Phycisphaerales bacterium]|nr:hypothetical protein PHYC_00136 [Phycisphaerales bacterium]